MKHKSTFVYSIIVLIDFALYAFDLEFDESYANLLLPIKAIVGMAAIKISIALIKNVLLLLLQIFAIGCIIASVVLLAYS